MYEKDETMLPFYFKKNSPLSNIIIQALTYLLYFIITK